MEGQKARGVIVTQHHPPSLTPIPPQGPVASAPNMKAVILAAGNGTRLSATRAKCLLPVGETSLLQRQLHALRHCGVRQAVVVVGYQQDQVRAACDGGVRFVENPWYRETNSLYSLWLAREHLTDGFLVLNSDVLFHHAMLADLVRSQHEAALLMAYRTASGASLGAEEMKVKVSGTRVTDISKEIDPAEADGESVGIAKFGPAQARHLIRCMRRLIENGGSREWAPRAFQEFARDYPLHVVGTGDHPWIEIDFPEDYDRAIHQVAPLLAD
jgi:choline kinase